MRKRLLSALLALCLALALAAPSLAANSDFVIENGVLTQYNGPGGNVVIPSGVTSIGDWAFGNCENLTSMTIPSSVTSIGEGAFAFCFSLPSVTIPNSVTSIGVDAFLDCSSLTSVTIPNSVTRIGDGAFCGCVSLTGVTIPNSVTSIGEWVFAFCYSLPSVTIPSSVTSIGAEAFYNCDSLTDIYYGGTEAQWKRITIGEDNDDLLNAAIHYNSTVGKEYIVSCSGYGDDGKVKFTESLEDCIKEKQSSGDYNPKLAHMLIAMCNSVYNSADMAETFDSFGFSYKQPRYEKEFITYSVAKKYMTDGTPLVLVVAKGTGPLPWEENSDTPGWGSNVWGYMSTRGDLHSGYADAADEVYRSIKDILKDDAVDLSKAKFVLTGFSRGAATANVLAKKLNDEKVAQSHIYAYTFACPDVTKSKYYGGYECIFNIADAEDFVSWTPSGSFEGVFSGWNKFGRSYWFSDNWNSSYLEMGTDAHDQTKYLEYLGKSIRYEKGTSEFKRFDEAKKILDTAADRRSEKSSFADVTAGQWYYDSVYWAVQNGVTNGTSATTFSPDQDCTEIQILTFLWRAAGKPAADAALPVNVTGVADYVSAAKWAFSKGMIDASFKQDTPCTRARAVMLMWQAAGSPAASGSGFADVPANAAYAQAVSWAVGEGITNGTGKNTFSPGGICSRGHIVTFLYRDRG